MIFHQVVLTREEAVQVLKNHCPADGYTVFRVAIQMAIEALEETDDGYVRDRLDRD